MSDTDGVAAATSHRVWGLSAALRERDAEENRVMFEAHPLLEVWWQHHEQRAAALKRAQMGMRNADRSYATRLSEEVGFPVGTRVRGIAGFERDVVFEVVSVRAFTPTRLDLYGGKVRKDGQVGVKRDYYLGTVTFGDDDRWPKVVES